MKKFRRNNVLAARGISEAISPMDLQILLKNTQEIVRACKDRDIPVRVCGSFGFRLRCVGFEYLQTRAGRQINDLDFVAYMRDKQKLERLIGQMGYRINKELAGVPGLPRSVFYSPQGGFHCDFFYNTLFFCHTIDLTHRLEVDPLTIPLAELLLQKLQIVKINRKDIYDIQMLLCSHELGGVDGELINLDLLSDLCRNDWGLWQTVTTNLDLLRKITLTDDSLSARDRNFVLRRISKILESVNQARKTTRWRLRAVIGKKLSWYNEVEEIDHSAAADPYDEK
jgi:hypothetical protein